MAGVIGGTNRSMTVPRCTFGMRRQQPCPRLVKPCRWPAARLFIAGCSAALPTPGLIKLLGAQPRWRPTASKRLLSARQLAAAAPSRACLHGDRVLALPVLLPPAALATISSRRRGRRNRPGSARPSSALQVTLGVLVLEARMDHRPEVATVAHA
ncbi:hypothetical protein PHYPSEUDO_001605 [Phytophthora pseudosyringae]|uniref:Uncharacterized protein n=1 Tax=Phytophthora pseudosyringae TaxID=221518 RepID=A0A8T1V2S6_9STRA|nr:hypothetical protein PHYPSEUDO_001605 [Phytophthora pseudosyringae]